MTGNCYVAQCIFNLILFVAISPTEIKASGRQIIWSGLYTDEFLTPKTNKLDLIVLEHFKGTVVKLYL